MATDYLIENLSGGSFLLVPGCEGYPSIEQVVGLNRLPHLFEEAGILNGYFHKLTGQLAVSGYVDKEVVIEHSGSIRRELDSIQNVNTKRLYVSSVDNQLLEDESILAALNNGMTVLDNNGYYVARLPYAPDEQQIQQGVLAQPKRLFKDGWVYKAVSQIDQIRGSATHFQIQYAVEYDANGLPKSVSNTRHSTVGRLGGKDEFIPFVTLLDSFNVSWDEHNLRSK